MEQPKQKNKYKIAFYLTLIISLVLAFALISIFILKPQIDNYLNEQKIEGQKILIRAIISVADEKGYIVLQDDTNRTLALIKYIEPSS